MSDTNYGLIDIVDMQCTKTCTIAPRLSPYLPRTDRDRQAAYCGTKLALKAIDPCKNRGY